MIDLTGIVEEAHSRSETWSEDAFVQASEDAHHAVGRGVLDWDNGVPENWATIYDEGGVLAMICRVLPLCVFRAEFEASMKPVLNGCQAVGLSVQDWHKADFRIQAATLLKCFRLEAIGAGIDTDRFSADELWFATVI